MKRILVIIDMQRGFRYANALITINKVIKQVNRAIKFGEEIYVVEYLPHKEYDATRPEIMTAIGDYPHIKVYKYDDNGSKEILDTCKSHKGVPDVFRLCGVNTNACVQATIRGLYGKRKRFGTPYDLEIVPEACNGYYSEYRSVFKQLKDDFNTKCIGRTPTKKPVRYI